MVSAPYGLVLTLLCGFHLLILRPMTTTLLCDRIDSEIGQILTVMDQDRLCALDFVEHEDRMIRSLEKRYPLFELTAAPIENPISDRIRNYFTGNLTSVNEIPVKTQGTEFQTLVWQTLRQIPVGQVWSYQKLAIAIGKPKAVRAVGMANRLNPVQIVIPCHRVVGANGNLIGYAGGIERKQWLLNHEGVALPSLSNPSLL